MQPITTYRRDLLNPLKKACVSWEVRQSEYVNVNYIFDLVFLQNAAMVEKKLLVDDKIQACLACVKQIYLLGVVRNVPIRKTLSC